MSPSNEPTSRPPLHDQDRLTSWKEIAAYLQRSVMTAQRWEKTEALPVHRHPHQKQDSVYAFKSEIDHWWHERRDDEVPRQMEPPPVASARRLRVPRLLVMAVGVAVASAALGAWGVRSRRVERLRHDAMVEITQLADSVVTYGSGASPVMRAYRKAIEAEQYSPGDSELLMALRRVSRTVKIEARPGGLDLSVGISGDIGHIATITGSAESRLPKGIVHWRATKPGYASAEGLLDESADTLRIRLDPVDSVPPGMVRATGGSFQLGLTHLGQQPPFTLSDYWIDKYEVTNRQFRRFIEDGGYVDPRFWKERFVGTDGAPVSFAIAMRRFHDRTGQPGPATWSGGNYPEGQGDHPVTGVSWYEAMAFAAYAGKSLPTIYHWARAAGVQLTAAIVPTSNFGTLGIAPVGKYGAVSAVGALDMAGNAKEWCLNATAQGRIILGGAWNEPQYMFNEVDGQSPWSRGDNYGFRLVKYIAPPAASLAARIDYPRRDFRKERPVPAGVFEIYRGLYSYDRTPLHATVDSVDDSDERWRKERISFDAAYGGERVTVYLYTPRTHRAPLQTIVYFPGSVGFQLRTSRGLRPPLDGAFVTSGRAFVFPVFKGTFERADALTTDYPSRTDLYRQHVLAWFKDLERTIDYVETRPDLDRSRIAYYGFSWGARLGPLFLALDSRIKTAVLVSGGLKFADTFPELDPFNFASHVHVPVLMINGRYDYFFPVETSQQPLFELLGTPLPAKKHIVLESSHVPPSAPTTAEALQWLDRYLGAVAVESRTRR